jgi:lysophospholipase L1-like esterase
MPDCSSAIDIYSTGRRIRVHSLLSIALSFFRSKRRGTVRMALALFSLTWCGACNRGPSAPTDATRPPVATPAPRIADPPSLTCPQAVTVTAPTGAGATIAYPPPDGQNGEGAVTVACNPDSGTMFPVGTTAVECVITDSLKRTGSCTFSVTVAAPLRLRRTRIMAFGDSITEGQIVIPGTDSAELVSRPDIAYPAVLSQLLSRRYTDQPIAVFNRGHATEQAARARPRLTTDLLNDSPDVVVLLEGYNDIIFGESGSGILAAAAGVNELAATARLRGARVFICTLSPSKAGRRQIPMSAIREANDRLRDVARGEGAYLVDVFSALLPDVEANVSSDGLHLTELGYRRLAETVFAAIRADLEIQ